MMRAFAAVGVALALAAGAAQAEPTPREGGFTVRNTVEVAAPPARVWAELVRPGRWWDSTHSWSGDAANMTLEPRAGGCFCERLADGGSAMHGQVLFVEPNKTLRLSALLGPLMTLGASGVLSVGIEPAGSGSRVTLTYAVGGLASDTARTLAGPVDGVLRTQLERLDRLVETGRAGAPG